MTAEIIRLDVAHPEKALVRFREVVRGGGVVVYPTETFYGLGVDARNREAVERIFSVKGRSAGQPVLVLLPDAAHVAEWAAEVSPEAKQLMDRFWPGPLTLVFKARLEVLPSLTGGTASIGLRVPGSDLTRDILKFIGCPLTGTSANRTGEASVCTAAEAARAVGDRVDLILDAGPTAGGKPSTVVDVRSMPFKVVRPGAIDI